MKVTLAVSLLLLVSVIGLGQERYLKPVDEASLDKSFAVFRAKLITAARKHDAQFIYAVVDPKINISFGGDGGIAEFKELWKLETSGSTFWKEFLACIENGGLFF